MRLTAGARSLSERIVWISAQALGWAAVIVLGLLLPGDMRDTGAYYGARLDDMYASSTFMATGYVYSPVFALLVEPFRWLDPMWLMLAVRLSSAIALGYLVTPWLGAVLIVGDFPGLQDEMGVGNLDLVVAAILVSILARPWLWPTLLLTKVTPAVALVWHITRREWRQLATAVLATTFVIVVSLPFTSGWWATWIDVLTGENVAIADAYVWFPLWVRGLLAIGVVAYGAHTDRMWLVPVAVALSFPSPNAPHWLVMLAIPRLWTTADRGRVAD